MHEASLIAGLMHRIEDVARAQNARRVVCVSVRLGALSHLSQEHFAEHFERAASGTMAQGAQLRITVCDDPGDAGAQDVMLEGIEIET